MSTDPHDPTSLETTPLPPEMRRPGKALRAGEVWVWFCAMGLAIGLLMTLGLLGVILANGVQVFWPKRIVELTVAPDSEVAQRFGPVVTGAIVHERYRSGPRDEEAAEWRLFVGNQEVYGSLFTYLETSAVTAQREPAGLMRVERRREGDAIFYPTAVIPLEGERIAADDVAFRATLARLVDEAHERWREIRILERNEIGDVNAALENARRERDRILDRARGRLPAATAATLPAIPPDAVPTSLPEAWGEVLSPVERDRLADLGDEIIRLEYDYRVLTGEASQLRLRQDADQLEYRLPTGEEGTLAVGEMVHYYYPNQLGLFARLSLFVDKFVRFVTEEPREANLEGGIFPAIFGTFIMTVLMSAAVMPFGLLAAIYLHEYARQGPTVRAVRVAVNNLAGVPSIVFGVFGLGFFVYVVGGAIDAAFYSDRPHAVFGTGGILWASLTLALMTVPVVIVASEEALAAVPRGMREASMACGASKWQTILRVLLPASAPGVLTGLILAMARGAGEVAPLMLVGVVKLAPSLPIDTDPPFFHLERKFMHLGYHIFDLGFQSPDTEAARPMVFATTLLLLVLVIVLNLAAIVLRNYLRQKYRTEAF